MNRQRISVMVDPLRRLMRKGAKAHAANLISKLHAADVARLLLVLGDTESRAVFDLVLAEGPARSAEVLAELDANEAVSYLVGHSDSQVAALLAEMSADDAAMLAAALPEDLRERVLTQLGRTGQPQVEEILQYAEETAGRIMAPEVFALSQDLDVSGAIEALRSSRAEDLEMVFYLYVVDADGHLVGVCSLRDLLLARPDRRLREVMNDRPIAVSVDTDQEEVAQLVARYNYLALPVVDHDNRLVGLITVDDVIDIIREEETEDILLMAGVGEDAEEVLTAPLWRNAWLRLPWLFAAWLGGIGASQVLSHYSAMLAQVVALSFFIPIIVGMAGNVGTQSATIVVRGLATGRLILGQTVFTVLRELRVALALGLLFGLLLTATVLALDPTQPTVGAAAGLALFASMAMAATVGASMPLALRRFGVDPAIATGPFVTTAIDVLGITTYFAIASWLVL